MLRHVGALGGVPLESIVLVPPLLHVRPGAPIDPPSFQRGRMPLRAPPGLDLRHESRQVDIKRTRETVNVDKADVALAALDAAYVGPVEPGPFAEHLLAHVTSDPESSDCLPECQENAFGNQLRHAETRLA